MTGTPPTPRHVAAPTPIDVPVPYHVVDRVEETHDVVTLWARPTRGPLPHFRPAQFSMIGVPGLGDVPVSISSPTSNAYAHSYTVRAAGAVTQRLCALTAGDVMTVRGPIGRPWDLDAAAGRPLLFVAGGIGIAPLRAAIESALEHPERYDSITVLAGAARPADLVYAGWLAGLHERGVDVRVAVDRYEIADIDRDSTRRPHHVGLVTELIPPVARPESAAMICGPDQMMTATIDVLSSCGVPADAIQLTLERNMHCGHGTCGHCQLGALLVCRDGPVVTAQRLGDALKIKEL